MTFCVFFLIIKSNTIYEKKKKRQKRNIPVWASTPKVDEKRVWPLPHIAQWQPRCQDSRPSRGWPPEIDHQWDWWREVRPRPQAWRGSCHAALASQSFLRYPVVVVSCVVGKRENSYLVVTVCAKEKISKNSLFTSRFFHHYHVVVVVENDKGKKKKCLKIHFSHHDFFITIMW